MGRALRFHPRGFRRMLRVLPRHDDRRVRHGGSGGIFMPSIFLGACGGGALGLCFRELLPESWDIQPGLYALIGATAMLGGVFRSSISLVVIMVEGTGGITFVFCIIVAVVVSNAVSSWLQKHGVYHMDLHRNDNVATSRANPRGSSRCSPRRI